MTTYLNEIVKPGGVKNNVEQPMIKTIGELKKAIENIDDDFTIDVRIVKELSEEELKDSKYPYPYEYSKANIEIGDIGYSDKDIFINVYEDSAADDVCEWKIDGDMAINPHNLSRYKIKQYNGLYALDTCPHCRKKIKVVERWAD